MKDISVALCQLDSSYWNFYCFGALYFELIFLSTIAKEINDHV